MPDDVATGSAKVDMVEKACPVTQPSRGEEDVPASGCECQRVVPQALHERAHRLVQCLKRFRAVQVDDVEPEPCAQADVGFRAGTPPPVDLLAAGRGVVESVATLDERDLRAGSQREDGKAEGPVVAGSGV
jgi:hypothetical protein